MPRVARRDKPPEPMTRARSLPVLLAAILFDALRFVFNGFWFFGPLFVGAGVGTLVGSVAGTTLGAAAGVIAGAVAGVGTAMFEAIGIILAFLTDLLGWLTVWLLLMVLNHRIFKANGGSLSMLLGIIVGGVPFVGSVPVQSVVVWRMYSVQIKKEREDLKRWEQENAGALAEQRREQAALLQARAEQQVALAQAEKIQAEEVQLAQLAAEQQAANDASYIPEEVRRAA